MRIVVLGVGNTLLSDEGIGVRAVEKLQQDYDLPPEVVIIDGSFRVEIRESFVHDGSFGAWLSACP